MSDIVNLPTISVDAGFSKYLREINNIPSLTQEEEFMLAKAYLEEHDLEAAQRLVTSHLKLVAKIAMKYKNYGLPVPELVSEGNLGLMQAVKKYDPDLGHRLSTYAMWWIKASIQEYVLKSWSLVKIGTTSAQKKLFFNLKKMKNKIISTNARPLNEDDYKDIAEELGVTVKEVGEMNQRLSGSDISLNRSIDTNDDNSGEMIELIPEVKPSQETNLEKNQVLNKQRQVLAEAMQVLNAREVKILTARKLNDSPSTLDSLSNEYSISKERVRQIENRAFEKIQDYVLKKMTSDGQLKLADHSS
jgi:RNA polymerase sigma-32 factor